MKAVVFGGAGFIGSNLAKKLLDEGNEVTVFDSLYTGKMENMAGFSKHKNFKFIKADMRNLEDVKKAVKGQDIVYNLVANADIRGGMENTFLDFEYNAITAYNALEAMRKTDVKKIVFTSSSAVYGEPSVFPTPENYGPLAPTSLYGASKLSAEGYVAAFCEDFGMQSWIFRFVNILGSANNHGVVGDFIRKLKKNPRELEILGDGKQRKSCLHISDCLSGIETAVRKAGGKVNILNIGNGDYINVDAMADEICAAMGLSGVKYSHTGGIRGWTGDMPFVFLDNKKLRALGWKPSMDSRKALRAAAEEMLAAEAIEDKHKQHY